MSAPIELDALVVGAGIAGLWTAQRLRDAGQVCAVVERDGLGAGQTLVAQGIIHGGLKYALGGRSTRASEAIAAMPDRWRACLAGTGEVDLSAAAPLADACWLWADDSPAARLAARFTPALLQGRAEPVARPDWPPFLAAGAFDGLVLRLAEPVVDVPAVLRALAGNLAPRLLRLPDATARLGRDGSAFRLEADDADLRARTLVLCAGAGNAPLLRSLGRDHPTMQLRGLHQVCLDVPGPPAIHGHCLTGQRGTEPPLTVTSHALPGGGTRLYLGGALASEGTARDRTAQIDAARRALALALPELPLTDAPATTLRVDRAEPATPDRRRPDGAFVAQADGLLIAWPTKLALAPDLADRVLARLPPPAADGRSRDARLVEALAGAERPRLAPDFGALAA